MGSKDFLVLIAKTLHRLTPRHPCWPTLLMWSDSLVLIYFVWHLILLPHFGVFWVFSSCSLYWCCSYATSKAEKSTWWSLGTAPLVLVETNKMTVSHSFYLSTDKDSIRLILQACMYTGCHQIHFSFFVCGAFGLHMTGRISRRTETVLMPSCACQLPVNLWPRKLSWVCSPRKWLFGVVEC